MGSGASRVAVAALLAAWLGCEGSSVFLCQGDGECQQRGTPGVCEATGYCSFPDDDCDSGRRYGDHAGGSLAQTCVELGAATGTDSTSGSSTAPTPEPGSSGSEGPAPGDTTSGGSGGCWVDEFDDDLVDRWWCEDIEPGVEVSEHDGRLWLDFVPGRWGDGERITEIQRCEPFPLLGAVVTAEAAQMPTLSTYTEGFFEMGTDDERLGLGVIDGSLYAFVGDGRDDYEGVAWEPYDPALRYWRVRGVEAGMIAEYSADGIRWVHMYTMPLDIGGAYGIAVLGGWGEVAPSRPDAAAFERIEVCVEP